MLQLKSKVVLKSKGERAALPETFTELRADLRWHDNVDLDLMAFVETKSGQVIPVYSDQISKDPKSLGDLNATPYVHLSGDAGVGAVGGDNVESLVISKLDDIQKLHLVALNYTAASQGKSEAFSKYDGGIEVKTDKEHESFGMLLDAVENGVASYVALIDNSGVTPKLEKVNEVLSLDQLFARVPGAREALSA